MLKTGGILPKHDPLGSYKIPYVYIEELGGGREGALVAVTVRRVSWSVIARAEKMEAVELGETS